MRVSKIYKTNLQNEKKVSWKDKKKDLVLLLGNSAINKNNILFRDVVTVLKLEGPNYNGPLSPHKNGGAQLYFHLMKSQKIGGGRAPLAR